MISVSQGSFEEKVKLTHGWPIQKEVDLGLIDGVDDDGTKKSLA